MLRRIVSTAVVGAALLAAFGCGSSGNDASVDSGSSRQRHVAAADPGAESSSTVSANGLRTVTYQGVQFDVPGDWPVYDLTADPTTCVRFDQHAVYLGTPSPDMQCPSQIIGRADAVLVEPTEGANRDVGSASGDVSAATASGLEVQVAPDGASTNEVAANVPSAGVSVTLTYADSDSTAQQILQSFRTAS